MEALAGPEAALQTKQTKSLLSWQERQQETTTCCEMQNHKLKTTAHTEALCFQFVNISDKEKKDFVFFHCT